MNDSTTTPAIVATIYVNIATGPISFDLSLGDNTPVNVTLQPPKVAGGHKIVKVTTKDSVLVQLNYTFRVNGQEPGPRALNYLNRIQMYNNPGNFWVSELNRGSTDLPVVLNNCTCLVPAYSIAVLNLRLVATYPYTIGLNDPIFDYTVDPQIINDAADTE